jgi:uncharacterized membrane protein
MRPRKSAPNKSRVIFFILFVKSHKFIAAKSTFSLKGSEIIFLTSVLVFIQCTQEPYPAIDNSPTASMGCDPDSVYFQQTILPLLSSNCAQDGCHNSASSRKGIILEDHNSIMASDIIDTSDPMDSELLEVLMETDPDKVMPPPPAAPLTASAIQSVRLWIEQGAKNNSCSAECDTADVRFSTTISSLLNTHCVACHNSNNASKGVQLDDYSAVVSVVNSGRLISVLNGTAYPQMPPSRPLDFCSVRSIELWIQDGAPNN